MSKFQFETCSTYQQSFYDVLGVDHYDATAKQKRDFFESHLSIIEKNLLHKNNRKIFSGILICMKKPNLNTQKDHKIMKFLCICFLHTKSEISIT
jgi:hypothetical protein